MIQTQCAQPFTAASHQDKSFAPDDPQKSPRDIEEMWEDFIAQRSVEFRSQGQELSNIFRLPLGYLDEKQDYRIVVWHNIYSDEADPDIHWVEGSLVEVYTLTPWGVFPISAYSSLDEMSIDASLSGRDINGDGLPEIILSGFKGGNGWGCEYIQIFQILPDGEMKELKIDHSSELAPKELKDLNKDGIYEIIAINTHWEMEFDLCHACSPGVWGVYVWQDGKYIDGSKKFPQFYDHAIAKLESHLSDLTNDPGDRQFYMGAVISILLNYIQKGEAVQGWARFKTLTDRPEFHNKESVRWIQEIKNDITNYYKGK